MPIDYHIDKARKLVLTTAKGRLTKYELLNHQNRVLDDPDFDLSFWQLHDMRGADLMGIYADCVEALAGNAVPKNGTRSAIVVRDELGEGLARTFEKLREGTGEQIRVFRDLAAAQTWLKPVPDEAGKRLVGRVQDRRVAPRVSADLQPSVPGRANFVAGDVEGSGQILNVSTSGAFVAGPSHHLEAGTEVDLYFLEPKTGRRLHTHGRVVRGEDSGFAVQFTRVERELQRLVLVAAGKAKDRK